MRSVIILAAVVLAVMGVAFADVPQVINYQGRLTDNAGSPVSNGSHSIKFIIYGSEAGDDSLWSSGYQSVQVTNGLFTYQLGSDEQLPHDLFSQDTPRFLGITVSGSPEISPRTKISSSVYAYHSLRADTAMSVELPLNIYRTNYPTLLNVYNATTDVVSYAIMGSTDAYYGVLGYCEAGVYGVNKGNSNQGHLGGYAYGTYGWHHSTGNYGYLGGEDAGVYGESSGDHAGYFEGDVLVNGKLEVGTGSNLYLSDGYVGIGEINPAEKLHVEGKVYISSMDASLGGYNVRWENNRLKSEHSSFRYKDKIEPLEEDFGKMLQAEPKSFVDRGSGKQNIGYIAEEFDEVGLENLVIYDEQGRPDAIRYDLISVYLVEMVKGLKAENEDLKQRIKVIEEQL